MTDTMWLNDEIDCAYVVYYMVPTVRNELQTKAWEMLEAAMWSEKWVTRYEVFIHESTRTHALAKVAGRREMAIEFVAFLTATEEELVYQEAAYRLNVAWESMLRGEE